MKYRMSHLEELEAESIYVIREAYAQFDNPCFLFSGGKDSIVVTDLAAKVFAPAKIPFPLVHIDTGHNFEETFCFRDDLVNRFGARLVVNFPTRNTLPLNQMKEWKRWSSGSG